MSVFSHPEFDHHDSIHFFEDPASGLKAIVAIHSTALGPAAGLEGRRARLREIVTSQRATWRRCPAIIASDFYARILGVAGLESLRARCMAELDTRGPWLRAMRAIDRFRLTASYRLTERGSLTI